MKKIVLFLVLINVGVIFTTQGQDYTFKEQEHNVTWYSFTEAVELNKSKQKKIFIDVYTDWCGWCKKMEATTFAHPTIAKILNEDYYAVRFDAETNDTILFAGKQFINDGNTNRSPHQLAVALLQGKMSYPSVAYLNEENQLLTAVPGYYSADRLEPLLKFFAEDAFKTQTFEDYSKNFKSTISTKK